MIIEPVHDNMGTLGALFQPMADGMAELWSKLDDDELDVIIKFMRRNNALASELNARLRAQPPPAGTSDRARAP